EDLDDLLLGDAETVAAAEEHDHAGGAARDADDAVRGVFEAVVVAGAPGERRFRFDHHVGVGERRGDRRGERLADHADEAVVDQRRGAGARDDVEVEVLLEHHRRAEVERHAAVERAERHVEQLRRALRVLRGLGEIADQREQIGDLLLHVMLHGMPGLYESGHYNSVRWRCPRLKRFHSSRWTYAASGCSCWHRIRTMKSSAAADWWRSIFATDGACVWSSQLTAARRASRWSGSASRARRWRPWA